MDERKYERKALKKAYKRAERRSVQPAKKLTLLFGALSLAIGVIPQMSGMDLSIVFHSTGWMKPVAVVFGILAVLCGICWIAGIGKFMRTEEYIAWKAYQRQN